MSKDEAEKLGAAIRGEPMPKTLAEILEDQLRRSIHYRRMREGRRYQ